jgi:hypothetical protein
VIEGVYHVPSEEISCTSWTQHPALYICINFSVPSGSDHMRSHIEPSWGISCLRSIERIFIWGDVPNRWSRWCWDWVHRVHRTCCRQLWLLERDSRRHQCSSARRSKTRTF